MDGLFGLPGWELGSRGSAHPLRHTLEHAKPVCVSTHPHEWLGEPFARLHGGGVERWRKGRLAGYGRQDLVDAFLSDDVLRSARVYIDDQVQKWTDARYAAAREAALHAFPRFTRLFDVKIYIVMARPKFVLLAGARSRAIDSLLK
ncbi:hypothetical protein pkur_cds_425 [Pandoravirus kuranda]|uniref:Uncharacterized protein n=1 Tax=Pandoravirus kuranda TaxID=3019033 RepID=A0AA95EDW8_9VIRU|nr:hypothetical protein pkur_cds_425 [Pandoravirus kuranda]